MLYRYFLSFALAISISSASIAADLANGVVGVIMSSETGGIVEGAVISVVDGDQSANSDGDGYFELSLEPGTYNIKIAHPNYSSKTIEDINVAAGQVVDQQVTLSLSGSGDIEEVVAIGTAVEETALAEERDSKAVLDSIGAEDVARFGDSTAASALKRVAGVTLNDGKYAVVRGINERYTAVTLNGSTLPSPDPTRRSVPLDIFPSTVIDGVTVQKSFTPNISSDSTGGAIRLKTKDIPEDPQKKFSASIGYRQGVTGENMLSDERSSTDFWGMDDGQRELPTAVSGTDLNLSNFNVDPALQQAAGRSLENNWALEKQKALPDLSLEYSQGNTLYDIGDGSIGYTTSIKYRNKWKEQSSVRNTYNSTGTALVIDDSFNNVRDTNSIDLGGAVAFEWRLNEFHSLLSNTMLLRQSQMDAQFLQGVGGDQNRAVQKTSIDWNEREFFIQQFSGEHLLPSILDSSLSWRYSTSEASLDAPDSRAYNYERDVNAPMYELYISTVERSFSELDDKNSDFGIDWEALLFQGDSFGIESQIGITNSSRERSSDIARYGYQYNGGSAINDPIRFNPFLEQVLSPARVSTGQFELVDKSQSSDTYVAEWDMSAWYVNVDLITVSGWEFSYGVRNEDSEQTVNTFDLSSTVLNPLPVTASLDDEDTLPAYNVSWAPRESIRIRFGFSETKNRPEFRELANATFFDPETKDLFIGNPFLRVSDIENTDLRFEWYLSEVDSISFAYFTKDFTLPIEQTAEPTTGTDVVFSFDNARSATTDGFEIDFRKEMGSGDNVFFVGGNLAVIDSKVTLFAPDATGSISRDMQGQPEDIFNLQLGLNRYSAGQEYTLLFNREGEKLGAVGVSGLPNIIEEPNLQVDLIMKQEFGTGSSLRLKLQNLTDEEVEWTQGGNTFREFTEGRYFEVGFSVEF